MTHDKVLIIGAVAYDPKVVTIWNGFQQYFAQHGLGLDYILYSNYERQVEAHFCGDIDVAWNSPLAWLHSVRFGEALGRCPVAWWLRVSDCDLRSVIGGR